MEYPSIRKANATLLCLTLSTLVCCGQFITNVPNITPREDSNVVRGVRVESISNLEVLRIAEHNEKALSHYRQVEAQYYKNAGQGTPRYCITFSGGGIRSAAFNIGVMKALEEKGRLQNLDLISSVSGGSYAAAWLYTQRHASPEGSLSSLFDDTHINYVADRAKFVQWPSIRSMLSASLRYLSGTMFALAQIMDGRIMYVDATWFQIQYETAIRRAFLTAPSGKIYVTAMPDIKEIVSSHHLPTVVFNSALVVPDRTYTKWGPRIFEITPSYMGSDAVGFYPWNPENSETGWTRIDRVARLSGAAVDATHEDSHYSQIAVQLTEASLGGYMPLEKESGVYLADGGFIDNLGAYTAIRRLCEEIIVVDAGYDPQYEFCDYRGLRDALSKEMDVDLKIEDIDSIVPRTLCVNPKPHPSSDQICPLQLSFNKHRPVMIGRVGPFPLGDGNNTLRVVYIKMAVDNKEFDLASRDSAAKSALGKKYSSTVQSWYEKRKAVSKECDPDFPHFPTTKQNFSAEQFHAYVDLGYATLTNQWDTIEQ
ncbi:MAG: patatin-like phospholipase family protein [Nitrospira sp.]